MEKITKKQLGDKLLAFAKQFGIYSTSPIATERNKARDIMHEIINEIWEAITDGK